MPTFLVARSVHWRDAPNLRVKYNFAQIFCKFLFILPIDIFPKLCADRARLCRARFLHPHRLYGIFCWLFDFHFYRSGSRNLHLAPPYATLTSLFLSGRGPPHMPSARTCFISFSISAKIY